MQWYPENQTKMHGIYHGTICYTQSPMQGYHQANTIHATPRHHMQIPSGSSHPLLMGSPM